EPNAYVVPRADGKLAVLAGYILKPGDPFQVRLLDVSSGQAQTVMSSDPAAPQWTGAAQHSAALSKLSYVHATWIGENTFALTLPPEDERAYLYHWGKVLVADAATKRVSVLAEEGQLVAALPDGTLLLRRGWIDGELQAVAPPYDAPQR